MSPGLPPPLPPPSTVGTVPTVPSANIPTATALGPWPTVLSVASQCISTSWPPSSSQLECLFSRFSSTGTYSQTPPSRTSDDPQPITPLCTSRGGASDQVCASVNLVPTEPSAALATPSASDLSAKPLITATSSPAQSPSQSQINATLSQGGHTVSVGLTVGLVLLGVFLAILIACFILRYRRHMCRRRFKDPLIDSILPLEKAIWPLPDITKGVESTFSSLPPPRTSLDSGPSKAPSVSACAESSYTQRSNTYKSIYPKDFQATGIAL